MFETLVYAADSSATTAGANGAGGVLGSIGAFAPLILIFVLMYFIMIRPQRKKEKKLREQIDAMKVGDKVTTIGGIRGKISKIKDDFVIVETGNIGTEDQKSFIKFSKSAISEVEQKIKG